MTIAIAGLLVSRNGSYRITDREAFHRIISESRAVYRSCFQRLHRRTVGDTLRRLKRMWRAIAVAKSGHPKGEIKIEH
jgi:hypothetical protein